MGTITTLLGRTREGGSLRLTRSEIELLVTSVYPGLRRELVRRFPGGRGFGGELGEDLTSEIVQWLCEAESTDLQVPSRVLDSRLFFYYLCDKACSRVRERAKTRAKRAGVRGGSGLDQGASGSEIGASTFGSIPDGIRAAAAAFDDPDAEALLAEGLDEARKDISVLDPNQNGAGRTFQERLANRSSVSQIAKSLQIGQATAYDHLDMARFCVMRRLGYEPEFLNKQFAKARDWERALGAHGRAIPLESESETL